MDTIENETVSQAIEKERISQAIKDQRAHHEILVRSEPAFPHPEDENYHAAEGISSHLYVATELLQGLLAKHSTSVRSQINDSLANEAIELAKILIAGCD